MTKMSIQRRLRAPVIGTALALAMAALARPAAAQDELIAQGRQIANQGTAQGEAACASCHGPLGEGSATGPRLAGAGRTYLSARLDAFANGTRKSPVMQPIAQKLSPGQRAAVVAYFSSLPLPSNAADEAQAAPAATAPWLVAWVRRIAAVRQ
jgi:cytochrome c553